MANLRVEFMFVLSVFLLITTHAFAKSSCKSFKFTTKKTFDNCLDLPTLNGVLHYTYDPTKSTLSMGFTAPPPSSDGWVAWALNPKATGMVGAQALIAYKPKPSGPITTNTLNIASYSNLIQGPLSYNVTSISAEESNGDVTIFATWVIPRGKLTVNQVWQVGAVVDGKPGVHDFLPDNLESTMELTLLVNPDTFGPSPSLSPSGAPITTPIVAPAGAPIGDGNAPAPSVSVQSGGAPRGVVSVLMALSAIVACFV